MDSCWRTQFTNGRFYLAVNNLFQFFDKLLKKAKNNHLLLQIFTSVYCLRSGKEYSPAMKPVTASQCKQQKDLGDDSDEQRSEVITAVMSLAFRRPHLLCRRGLRLLLSAACSIGPLRRGRLPFASPRLFVASLYVRAAAAPPLLFALLLRTVGPSLLRFVSYRRYCLLCVLLAGPGYPFPYQVLLLPRLFFLYPRCCSVMFLSPCSSVWAAIPWCGCPFTSFSACRVSVCFAITFVSSSLCVAVRTVGYQLVLLGELLGHRRPQGSPRRQQWYKTISCDLDHITSQVFF